jgi:phosphoserine phosphatase RsbU/P
MNKRRTLSGNPLAVVPFFAELPPEELDRVLSELEEIQLRAGTVLFREGDCGEHLYIMISGQLEILMSPGTPDELILDILHPGAYFGEMSLIQETGKRSTSARALDDVTLLRMSRRQFNELLTKHTEVAASVIKVLIERLDHSNLQTFRGLTEKNRQLRKAYDELKATQAQLIEKERLEKELQVAADIQMSILPDVLPTVEGFDFGGLIVPARQVGGDFYDVFDLGGGKMGVLIGDVADKGIPSAIFMARTHAFVIAEAEGMDSPGNVLRRVNYHITSQEKSAQFVTVFFGILNTETGEFCYARAGHELPLLMDADGTVHRLPQKRGTAIGVWHDIDVDEGSLHLEKNSLLVMFTDGMTDCRSPSGEAFGLDRVKEVIADLRGRSAQFACDHLLETLMTYQHGSPRDDDITLVAIHAK